MRFSTENISKVLEKMNNGRGLEIILKEEEGLKPTNTYNSYVSLNHFTQKLCDKTATRQPILLTNLKHYDTANRIADEIAETITIGFTHTEERDWGAYPTPNTKGFRKVSAMSSYIPTGWEYKIQDLELQVNGKESFDDFKERAIIILTIQVIEALSFIGKLK